MACCQTLNPHLIPCPPLGLLPMGGQWPPNLPPSIRSQLTLSPPFCKAFIQSLAPYIFNHWPPKNHMLIIIILYSEALVPAKVFVESVRCYRISQIIHCIQTVTEILSQEVPSYSVQLLSYECNITSRSVKEFGLFWHIIHSRRGLHVAQASLKINIMLE